MVQCAFTATSRLNQDLPLVGSPPPRGFFNGELKRVCAPAAVPGVRFEASLTAKLAAPPGPAFYAPTHTATAAPRSFIFNASGKWI